MNLADFAIENSAKAYNIFARIMKPIHDIPSDAIIYHYTSPAGFAGIIQNEQIWATDINYLNDNSELRYCYTLVDRLIRERKTILHTNFFEFLHNQCFQISKRYDLSNRLLFANKMDFYVISFSLEQDNLNMWKYYTKTPDSIGYNIGFEMTSLINEFEHDISYGRVIYSEKD